MDPLVRTERSKNVKGKEGAVVLFLGSKGSHALFCTFLAHPPMALVTHSLARVMGLPWGPDCNE